MNEKFKIFMLQFEQPDESVWKDILSFSAKWNRTKENEFINTVPFELVIYFSNEEDKEIKELENVLVEMREKQGWVWDKAKVNYYPTKEEKEKRDFIEIIGDGYPDEFLMNESAALSSAKPCEKCGTVDEDLSVQKKAFQINETYLDKKKIYPNNRFNPPGLDIVNMPNGALLVSKRVVELIKSNKKFHGARFLDVINNEGKISDRLFELVADKIILIPDNLPEEGAICPVCGTELIELSGQFGVRKNRLEGNSFFSRRPSGTASMYISNELYHFLKSENVRGLTPVQGADLIS